MELRLLVDVGLNPSSGNSISVEGRQWHLTEPLDISDSSRVPEYICISYRWGSGRCPSPLDKRRLISDQTLPALGAAVRSFPASAFWIDVFCVPDEQPQRNATLRSMGFIYHMASGIVVSFSGPIFAVLEQMKRSDRISEAQLEVLEQDEWISSVWTYQEVMNSKTGRLHFVSTQIGDAVIDGEIFLNRLGYSLFLYIRANGLSSFDIRSRFPRLDAMEDLIADWRLAAYLEISALQILSNLDRRSAIDPKNYLYASLGVISTNPSWLSVDSTTAQLSESFMDICEQKNDYSFIYSSTPRDETPGKRWRPSPGLLHAILPTHCDGSAQRGRYGPEGFWIDSVIKLEIAEQLGIDAREDIIQRFKISNTESSSDDAIASKTFHCLQQIGFTGRNRYVLSQQGFFFPQSLVKDSAHLTVLVTTEIAWYFGGPGIARIVTEGTESFTPGVFVGTLAKESALSILLDSTSVPRSSSA